MKIQIEIDSNCIEDEVIIRCKELNEQVAKAQRALSQAIQSEAKLELFKGDTDYFISINDILFFETDENIVGAHTVNNIFYTKSKLYELERVLPWNFSRISKSAILNIDKVYSITKNLTASSVVEFKDTDKQVYVSRVYYKPLKSKMEEKRKK